MNEKVCTAIKQHVNSSATSYSHMRKGSYSSRDMWQEPMECQKSSSNIQFIGSGEEAEGERDGQTTWVNKPREKYTTTLARPYHHKQWSQLMQHSPLHHHYNTGRCFGNPESDLHKRLTAKGNSLQKYSGHSFAVSTMTLLI